jgi:hypothetical protein
MQQRSSFSNIISLCWGVAAIAPYLKNSGVLNIDVSVLIVPLIDSQLIVVRIWTGTCNQMELINSLSCMSLSLLYFFKLTKLTIN